VREREKGAVWFKKSSARRVARVREEWRRERILRDRESKRGVGSGES
jgi:hypothetical protein